MLAMITRHKLKIFYTKSKKSQAAYFDNKLPVPELD